MKRQISLLLSTLLFAVPALAQLQPTKTALQQLQWQSLSPPQTQQIYLDKGIQNTLQGTRGNVLAYKIPANQGVLKIQIQSFVMQHKSVFVPNVLVLDSEFIPSMHYMASQFEFLEERGVQSAQFRATLTLTPTQQQDFIYLLIYTTDHDLQGKTQITHPAKLLAKAMGNQPPAISDLMVQHSTEGQVVVQVEGNASSQFIGAMLPTVQTQVQSVEPSTEAYFNHAVQQALKKGDVNKALNLVTEAEKLGLTQPRQLFLKQIAVQK